VTLHTVSFLPMHGAMSRRLGSLIALLLLALLLLPATGASARPGACSAAHVSLHHGTVKEARLATLCLLNRARADAGLRPLRLNGRLSYAARRHSHDMVARRYFAHDSLNGATPFQRMRATHYVPRNASWWLGENIGWGTGSLAQPAALVRAWMHSPMHRANILNPHFREIGIGIAVGAPSRAFAGQAAATYTTDFGSVS
jgi:uncharacterized protein YkwD